MTGSRSRNATEVRRGRNTHRVADTPTLSHAIPRGHGSTTPQKPHDFNVSAPQLEVPSGELHATILELNPLGSVAPALIGCNVADGVHDPIGNKLCRVGVSLARRHRD